MIRFFKKIFYPRKRLILSEILAINQGILRELTAMHGDSKNKEVSVQLAVVQMSVEIAKLTKMIYDMVENLSKYFKLEVEFMEKEKEKKDRKPTEHDHTF
ncbi:MAG: hypothetical protein KAW52_00525 [candidate division Zixibacteria bacterium]|nr:hypothetical protein [candidate division Zixibacteria bacterium]